METKYLGTSITIYACAVISLVLILSESSEAMLAFLLIIVMNVLGYNLVKKNTRSIQSLVSWQTPMTCGFYIFASLEVVFALLSCWTTFIFVCKVRPIQVL